jgi:hypothetical protein
MTREMRALLARLLQPLDRVEVLLDTSEMARSKGAVRVRKVAGLGVIGSALIVGAWRWIGSGAPSPYVVLMLLIGFVVYQGQIGRFVRDWSPVGLMFVVYGVALGLVDALAMPVWYAPQADVDRVIGLGTIPSVELQHWLDARHDTPLAVLAAFAYMSHFFVPVLLGFYVWYWRRGVGFNALMWTYITVSFLAAVMYVLTPAAPPWMAAERGVVPPVYDVIKHGLLVLGMDTLAKLKGDTSALYLTAAAFPSIHAAFPFIGVLVTRAYRMPRWIRTAMVAHLCIIWFTIVYTGEHYVADILGGVAFSLISWWIVRRVGDRLAARPIPLPSTAAEPQPGRRAA